MQVVVGNPGSIAEVSAMAAGLARAQSLRTYVSPVICTRQMLTAVDNVAPRWISRQITKELRRRLLPEEVEEVSTAAKATVDELVFVGAQRFGFGRTIRESLVLHRNEVFDRGLARTLSASDDAVIGCYGSMLRTIHRARELGVRSFLEYPIAHHEFSERILAEEAQLQPRYASTLQFNHFSPKRIQRLNEEIAHADRTFVLSSFQRRTFIEQGVNEDKLIVTPLGVDTDLFRPDSTKLPDQFTVLFVGQLTQRKGLSYLIDAFKKATLDDANLVFVGKPVGDALRLISGPKVSHVPHLPRWELPAQYQRASVYVLPSLVEGFPLTALEAMSCGCPVILSENTFAHDVVEDGKNGFIVPVRDSDAIAERLRYLHENPSVRAKMSIAAAERARDFTWESYGNNISEITQNVVYNKNVL